MKLLQVCYICYGLYSCVNQFTYLPGEGKIPNNWLREENFDAKGFLTLYPTGRYGLHHPRKIKLSAQKFFNQRLTMDDDRFAKNIPYVFMCMQYIERTMLENQINVSAQRGSVNSENKVTNLTGAFSVFKKIKDLLRIRHIFLLLSSM